LLAAATLPAGAARAQQAPPNRRPAQPGPQQPYPGPGYEGQPEPAPSPSRQPVPQRKDVEAPRLHFKPTAAPAAAGPKRPPTTMEAASSRSAVGGVQVEPKATKVAPGPSKVEEMLHRSQNPIDFYDLVDDMIDDIALQLGKEDPNLVSPMAIKLTRLSMNLRPEFARTLEMRVIARLSQATSVKMAMCAECTAMRSRVENGDWILTLGAVNQADLRRIGAQTGVKTFMELDFTYSPSTNVVWMAVVVYRASDGVVVWSNGYRSDSTMTALLRTGTKIPTRAERAAELEAKINARPYYGIALGLGVAQIGYTGGTGDIIGGTMSFRLHETFGENRSHLFGLSLSFFLTGPPKEGQVPAALNTGMLGAYYSYNLSPPNLNRPEVWFYGEGGGMFTGNEGNTFYLEAGADTHLKWRLSLQTGLMYLFHTKFAGQDLGGLGFRLRVAVNW
jgi:hypothetical protein